MEKLKIFWHADHALKSLSNFGGQKQQCSYCSRALNQWSTANIMGRQTTGNLDKAQILSITKFRNSAHDFGQTLLIVTTWSGICLVRTVEMEDGRMIGGSSGSCWLKQWLPNPKWCPYYRFLTASVWGKQNSVIISKKPLQSFLRVEQCLIHWQYKN
jgi:hypothetical protein